MEYERIDKDQQKGMISPTKLRMKLMSPHRSRKKREGSNSNSSRTSPSRLEVPQDIDFASNCLLASPSDAAIDGVGEVSLQSQPALDLGQSDHVQTLPCDRMKQPQPQLQPFRKGDLSMVHPMRQLEDENLDYDSNASSSSFEFHHGGCGGDRSNRNPIPKSYQRQMPSKWNDAEKWIMSRQNLTMKKNGSLCGQGSRVPVRVAPETAAGFETNKTRPAVQMDPPLGPTVRSVCMRDMGTEMTPGTSLEPSRTATPVGATTPLRSPTSSLPSTPRAATMAGQKNVTGSAEESASQRQLSEEEVKMKTRKEIVALGVQLGKTNIAAWASKEEDENKAADSIGKFTEAEETMRIDYEKRAAAWEEAEKSKHSARYKREEIKIRAWESQQKAKLEAEMRRIEAKVEQMKAQAEAKMVKKIAMARQRSEEKRAAAEARKSRDAEVAAAQSEFIRQTGRIPNSGYICCGWFS